MVRIAASGDIAFVAHELSGPELYAVNSHVHRAMNENVLPSEARPAIAATRVKKALPKPASALIDHTSGPNPCDPSGVVVGLRE
jgi:hypothetical protein